MAHGSSKDKRVVIIRALSGAAPSLGWGPAQNYRVEYNLDRLRFHTFRDFPSRLHALFLFGSREEALRYRDIHPEHIKGRILKRVISAGHYKFSVHDGAWIDFLCLPHGMNEVEINNCNDAYWRGELAEHSNNSFTSMAESWRPASFHEVLYYGAVQFPDRDLSLPICARVQAWLSSIKCPIRQWCR